MFQLALIEDTIKVEASQLGLDTVAALARNVNAKYANNVLPNVGLCVCHFDFSSVSEGHLKNSDGCTYYKAVFRLVVFRPFKGEVMQGRVKSCDEDGIRISIGFFSDIYVSREALPIPSGYDHEETAWFWLDPQVDQQLYFEDPLLSDKQERFYYDKNELVRFIVLGDEFDDSEAPRPNRPSVAALQAASGEFEAAKGPAPLYKIKASMSADGCGPPSWWCSPDADEEQQQQDP